jgi:hypothetical protein
MFESTIWSSIKQAVSKKEWYVDIGESCEIMHNWCARDSWSRGGIRYPKQYVHYQGW